MKFVVLIETSEFCEDKDGDECERDVTAAELQVFLEHQICLGEPKIGIVDLNVLPQFICDPEDIEQSIRDLYSDMPDFE